MWNAYAPTGIISQCRQQPVAGCRKKCNFVSCHAARFYRTPSSLRNTWPTSSSRAINSVSAPRALQFPETFAFFFESFAFRTIRSVLFERLCRSTVASEARRVNLALRFFFPPIYTIEHTEVPSSRSCDLNNCASPCATWKYREQFFSKWYRSCSTPPIFPDIEVYVEF